MASSLSTCGCIPSVSMDLLKISLSWSSFTEGKHEFFQIFPFAWEARDLWMSTLSVKTEAKLSTSTFSIALGAQFPTPFSSKTTFSWPSFCYWCMHSNFSSPSSLPSPDLTPNALWLCWPHPCTLIVSIFPASSALVSTSCMPPFVLQFCLEGIVQPYGSPTIFALVHSKRDHIWTCRRWFLKILQFPWTPLLSGPLTGPHCMGNS